jgi:hypothetical protein
MWLPVLLAHAAFGAGERTAAPSVVSAPVPELDPMIIGDFFGGSKVTTEVPPDAMEMQTTDALAQVGLQLAMFNAEMELERNHTQEQVLILTKQVGDLIPKLDKATSPDMLAKTSGSGLDHDIVKKGLEDIKKSHASTMRLLTQSVEVAHRKHSTSETKMQKIFSQSAAKLEADLQSSSSFDGWLNFALFIICCSIAGMAYNKVSAWEKKHVL